MLIQPQIQTHKCFSVSLQSLWQTLMSVCWCAAEFKPTRTHRSDCLLRFSGVIVLQLMHWLGSYVQLVRSGSATHSTPDPMASVWVVGIPPPVFAGKTQGEYLAVCLSPPSPALVDRGTHTSMPLWSDFPTRTHMHTCAHTRYTHTC